MTETTRQPSPAEPAASRSLLLAMAMFVLVVDTSLMNVSISAVVDDLDTTVSGVQSAIALEALVSAAFILIGSKIGDLFGRKRAYVLGLLGYAVGALAMTLAQSLTAIIIFWAIIGGLGASLLLPAMQSLIHGNFEGAAQQQGLRARRRGRRDRRRGRAADRRLHHDVPVVARRVPARGRRHRDRAVAASGSCRTCPTPGPRGIDVVGAVLSVARHGRHRARHPRLAGGRRGGGRAARRRRASRSAALACWLRAPQARGQADAARPGPVQVAAVPARDHAADAPADRARRRDDRAADLPADGARVQRDGGGPVARAAVAEHVRRGAARREAGRRPAPGRHHPGRVRAGSLGMVAAGPDRAARRLGLVPRGPADRSRAPGWGCSCRSSTTTRCRRSRRSGSARRPG